MVNGLAALTTMTRLLLIRPKVYTAPDAFERRKGHTVEFVDGFRRDSSLPDAF